MSARGVVGVVLAGGQGLRIGGNKPLLPFRDGALIDTVIAIAQPQVQALALNVPQADVGEYRSRYTDRFPLLVDFFPEGTGPLAGIVAGLAWAAGKANLLATFPCDAPFLPTDLVARLSSARSREGPIAVEDGERLQGLCALWPVDCLETLRTGVENGTLRSPARALEVLGGTRCLIADPGAFFNVNSLADLEAARRRL